MPAPGTVWATDSWDEDAWEADTWADAQDPPTVTPSQWGARRRRVNAVLWFLKQTNDGRLGQR